MSESNPEIELVKKWLDNPESVSAEELESAVARAGAARAAARTEIDYAVAYAVARAVAAVRAAVRAAARANVDFATHGYAVDDHAVYVDFAARVARRWVKEYEELTK